MHLSFAWNSLLHSALFVLRDTGLQFLGLFGVLFLSGFLLTLISKWTSNSFRQFRFPNLGLYLFGVIGIPLHELCHAFFAKLFFHKIERIKWFDPKGRGGSYGTVSHAYSARNLYHRVGLFFIGMGPVLLAPLFLLGAYGLLVPSAPQLPHLLSKPSATLSSFTTSLLVSDNWSSVQFYVFLYLAVCLTSQMELSPEDFRLARGGLLPLFSTLLLLNTGSALLGLRLQTRIESYFPHLLALWGTWSAFAVVVSCLNLAVCCVLLSLGNRILGHPSINPFRE